MPWQSYTEPVVRDLVWLIASAPISGNPDATDNCSYWPSAEQYLALYKRHEPWLRQLDAAPQPLLNTLSQARDLRLGRYAEDLLLFWLSAPDNLEFEHIAAHVALREQGITLGELDFLVRERETGQLWHIELALKFYLGTSDQRWLGPNRQDSLARKLNHLCQHQLPLLKRPAGQLWLQSQGLDMPKSWAWLKGRLFQGQHQIPSAQTPQWFSAESFHAFAQAHDYHWYLLEKKYWLATALYTPKQHTAFNVDSCFFDYNGSEAQAVIAYAGEREVLRAFVVGKLWPGLTAS